MSGLGNRERRRSCWGWTSGHSGDGRAATGDGSRHAWLEGEAPLDLIVTLDDATGTIYSAFLVEEEGTASTFRALNEVFSAHGLPMSLYTDRGAHYFKPRRDGWPDRPRSSDLKSGGR